MRKMNVLELPKLHTRFRDKVISARKAADRAGLAHNTFFKGLTAGFFVAQATIEGDGKNAYGFEPAYIDEVKKLIPHRVGGQSIFTTAVIAELRKVNAKWMR